MAYPQASPITLTPRQQVILEQIVRRPTSYQGLVKRVKLILAAAKGINNTQLSVALQTSRTTIRLWRKRWEGAVKRGIVEEISPRSVGRFLKRGYSTASSQPLLAQCQSR